MTLSELKKSTALLGFSETLTDLADAAEPAFFAALNRALWQVDSLRPRLGTLFLTHAPAENLVDTPHFHVMAGIPYRVSCPEAAAYYFEASGTGTCEGQTGGETFSHVWVSEPAPKAFYGVAAGDLTLTFAGNEDFEVRDLGIYDGRAGIPLPQGGGAYVGYALKTRAPDFSSLAEPPAIWEEDRYVSLTEGYYLEDGDRLYLARSCPGSYRIRYRRGISPVDSTWEEERTLPLEQDLCELLPLCLAYYLLLDDEPEKAGEYLNLFREQSVYFRQTSRGWDPGKYRSVNNW